MRSPSAPPGGVRVESAPCPLGCPAGDAVVLWGRDRLHGLPGRFRVVRCRACGLMRTDPRPTPESIGLYYPEGYVGWMNQAAAAGDPVPRWKRVLRSLAWDTRTSLTPPMKPGRLLDVGCGAGLYLAEMAWSGWAVEGVESSPEAAEAARRRGYRVHVGELESLPEPEGRFDLVTAWMVLEHLHDPVRVLRRLARWTSPEGVLALSVPDASAVEFRLFGPRWYALHVPNHLYHFTPATLGRVLRAGGWRAERVFHQRYLGNLVGSVGHLLEDWLGPGNAAARLVSHVVDRRPVLVHLLLPLATALAAAGQTGRITVWARKDAP